MYSLYRSTPYRMEHIEDNESSKLLLQTAKKFSIDDLYHGINYYCVWSVVNANGVCIGKYQNGKYYI